jgi:copper chaperone CopZ
VNAHRLEKVLIPLTGMTCTACATTVERVLRSTPGVVRAEVNFASQKALVDYNPAQVSLAGLKDAISRAGYRRPLYVASGCC